MILITGSTGYIGSHLSFYLEKKILILLVLIIYHTHTKKMYPKTKTFFF